MVEWTGRGRWVEVVGLAGLAAMGLSLLVWDTALTLAGVAAVGPGEEDAPLVRRLLAVHPVAWVAVKTLVVGGVLLVWWRLGVHRTAATVWVPWLVAGYGVLAPLGWLAFL
jgi:hypothetical protein